MEEEVSELSIDGENAVSVDNIDKFKGHRGRALHGIEIAAGWAEAAMAAKRDEFEFAALWAAIHGAAEGGITAAKHLINIFHDRRSWMKSI